LWSEDVAVVVVLAAVMNSHFEKRWFEVKGKEDEMNRGNIWWINLIAPQLFAPNMHHRTQ
jgi:hypothetical protein